MVVVVRGWVGVGVGRVLEGVFENGKWMFVV